MRGTTFSGYLLKGDEPYRTSGEAEERIRRIKRNNPKMKVDNSLVSGNNTWYYEIVPYGNGYAVLRSCTTNVTY